MVRMWLLAMFDSRIRKQSPNGSDSNEQKHLILEFTAKAAHLPLMAGVHQAMADPLDSSLIRPKFPHLYERTNAATSLLVLPDEVRLANGGTYFRERIQGLRKFADGIATLASGTQVVAEALLCKALGVSPQGRDSQVSWMDVIKKVSNEIESQHRISYLLYCLEAFAVLVPHCAEFLHKQLTMNRGMDSNALIDLIDFLFFDDFNHPPISTDLRVLQARATCVPAAILGFMKITCDKRLVEKFGSLMSFILLGAPPALRSAGGQVKLAGAVRRENLFAVFSTLFLRDSAPVGISRSLLKQSSLGKVNSAQFMVKVLVHSLFKIIAPPHSVNKRSASAAADVVKDLLKFLQETNELPPASDSASLSLECIQEILFLAATGFRGGLEDRDVISDTVALLDIVDAALCLLAFYLNAHRSSSEPTDAAISSRVSNPARLQASLHVITCRAVHFICHALLSVDGRRAVGEQVTQETTFSQKLLEAQNELTASSESHDAANLGHAASQRMLDGGVSKFTSILEQMQPSSEQAKTYDNCDEALTAVNAGAAKVLKGMLDLGEPSRRYAIWCADVTEGLVSSSAVKKLHDSLRQTDTMYPRVSAQCRQAQDRVAQWREFSDAAQEAKGTMAIQCPATDALSDAIGLHSGAGTSSILSAPHEVSLGFQDAQMVDASPSIPSAEESGRRCAEPGTSATKEDGTEKMWLQDVEQISDSESED